MHKKYIKKQIENTLIQEYISSNEEVAAEEYILNKKEKIIKKHTSTVYGIKKMKRGDGELYYTKLDPTNRNHCHMICAVTKEDLEDKIVAYYLGVEATNKLTVGIVLELAIAELTTDTAERHSQLFNKHFSDLKNIKVVKSASITNIIVIFLIYLYRHSIQLKALHFI